MKTRTARPIKAGLTGGSFSRWMRWLPWSNYDARDQLDAIGKSMAIIEFDLDGKVLDANQNFLNLLGYSLDEIRGRHHQMFVEPADAKSAGYRQFWDELKEGKYVAQRFRRLGKQGRPLWIEASYNPIYDRSHRVRKIVKVATDITALKMHEADVQGQVQAIGRAMAVIEFEPTGMIIDANENFLNLFGYALNEIKGKHHRLFLTSSDASSADYGKFWKRLQTGTFEKGTFHRVAHDGRDLWIEGTYNPIFDANGQLTKIIKFASDMTDQKKRDADLEAQLVANRKVMAVIEFDLDGFVLDANENFLGVFGYSLQEVKGKHHRMFVDGKFAQSEAYHQFWEKLKSGVYDAGQYRRLASHGREVWIEASYNPVLDAQGRPYKIIKFATDITRREQESRALAVLVKQVTEATSQVSEASAQMSLENQDLARRTEEQLKSLIETTQSMAQLTATVKDTSSNAKQACALSVGATDSASKGREVVRDIIGKMQAIDDSSKKISDITALIDGIAFQTNILALNAAVEAAHAGEQGRGFAIVASEVRTLAQRSADAARDIARLIHDSTNHVKEGNVLVTRAGSTMSDILAAFDRVNSVVSEIASATDGQNTDIEQVNHAIAQLGAWTRENATLVEKVARNTAALSEQAMHLHDSLDRHPGHGLIEPDCDGTDALQVAA